MTQKTFLLLREKSVILIMICGVFLLTVSLFATKTEMSTDKNNFDVSKVKDFPQTPTLRLSPTPVPFMTKDPQKLEFSLDTNGEMKREDLVIENEEQIKFNDYATKKIDYKKEPAEDKTKLVLEITPTGNTGSITLKVVYKGAAAPIEVPLTFGYKNVLLKEKQTALDSSNSTWNFGDKKDLTLVTDSDQSLKAEDIDIQYDDKILKVDKSKAPASITIEAIGVGESQLKVVVKGLAYSPVDKIKVKDVLTKVYLYDTDTNTPIQIPGDHKIRIFLTERKQRNFEVRGSFKSSKKDEKLPWIKFNGVEQSDSAPGTSVKALNDENGTLHITGNDLPKNLVPKDKITILEYEVKGFDAKDLSIASSVPTSFKVEVEVQLIDLFIELSTYQNNNILLPNGTVKIIGNVVDKQGNRKGLPITYDYNDEKDALWADLINEGGVSATLSWRTPSIQEIKSKYPGLTDEQAAAVVRPLRVVIKAKASSPTPGQPELQANISIRMAEIKKFTQLSVKLNIMDELTVGDLYGSVTAKDYYVLIVRLFNDLKDEKNGQPTGNSIIAYSGSMEIAVGLEKKYLKDSGSIFPRTITKKDIDEANKRNPIAVISPTPTPSPSPSISAYENEVTYAQTELEKVIKGSTEKLNDYNRKAEAYETTPNDANYNAAESARITANETLSRVEMAWERLFTARENFTRQQYLLRAPVKPEIGGPNTLIDDGKWHAVSKADFSRLVPALNGVPRFQSFSWANKISALPKPKELETARGIGSSDSDNKNEDPPCVGTVTYRPLTFEMVLNTVDRRDERSLRSRAFKLLDFVGTGTSFVTSFAVPGPGSDLPLGLEKYRNLLIPGLDKLFPSMKEQNRQNIVSQTMKPIEEIPYGSDITRVIFIPKKPFRGLIRGHETRISEICPFFFKIEVAVIQNATTVQQGTNIP